jgi:hypothetical protein
MILLGAWKTSFPASLVSRTILLEGIGVAFDIPIGFTALQWEDDEGTYKTGVSFGKEVRPGYFTSVPFEIGFGQNHVDCRVNRSHVPSACIDAEYRRVRENIRDRVPGYGLDPEYLTLFGNKAVRFTRYGPNRETFIFGYLRVDQLPERLRPPGSEYLARISFTQDIPAAEFDKAYESLIDMVIHSLRLIR